MKKIRVLVTGASSSNSLIYIRALLANTEFKFHVSGTDIFESHLSVGAQFCSAFHKVPLSTSPDFISTLLSVCKKDEIQILIPMIDEEFEKIGNARELFEKNGILVALPSNEAIRICGDKVLTSQFLELHKIATPKVLTEPLQAKDFPIILKPRQGRGSRGVKLIKDQNSIPDDYPKDEYFFQQHVAGTEYTIDTFSDRSARALVAIPRKRVEVRDGKSTKAMIVRNNIIEETAKKICDNLKIIGPACLQCFIQEDESTPYFFDLNPRIGSATSISVAAGVNIPLLTVKNLLDLKIEPQELVFKENLIMLRYWEDVFTTQTKLT